MGLNRRKFLQRSGWLLAALGISEALLWQMSDRYAQALAQPTRRKLALLVGINQYPNLEAQSTPLRGCVTDLEMQRELLISRFGFVPSDILSLTDSLATRQNIEAAFNSHLREQAKAGDVVVFHFSGFGSRISLDASLEQVQNSLVPVDDLLPTESAPIANDLLEETLLLLLQSLPTDNAIAILDASYVYPGTDLIGNLRIRSRYRPTFGQISNEELVLLKELRTIAATPNFIKLPPKITTAKPYQLAAELGWNGFSAGVFTYALTQSLWQTTDAANLQISFSQAASAISKLTPSAPFPQLQNQNSKDEKLIGNFSSLISNTPAGDGAVIAVEEGGKNVQLWLGGLPGNILNFYGVNSVFSLVPEITPRLQVRSRNGLVAKTQIRELASTIGEFVAPQVGQLVRERIRVLPRNIGLIVALDSQLERIERVDATSAFTAIPQVSVVTGEELADYRFGRVLEGATQRQNTPLPSLYQDRYGLFSVGQSLIPNTIGNGEEAVKAAVQRLAPQLNTLLAAKLLRLIANVGSSLLKVRATLGTIAPQVEVLIEQVPQRAFENTEADISDSLNLNADGIVDLPVGTRIQYKLYNGSDLPLYFMVFSLDSRGETIAFNPPLAETAVGEDTASLSPFAIAPGESIYIPPIPNLVTTATNTFGWLIHGSLGLVETQIVLSQAPFTNTLAALEGGMQKIRDTLPIRVLLNPLKVAKGVLQDLHIASIPGVQEAGVTTEDFALDVNNWATFSFVYRVI
ncbi:caspase family protein [Kamptonema sp. UHCC 0994]|uniref:caspase family protein n=1 Tax=Kamptonema sp. UHCC 0994 TaxID=3031329 RepID=UPI0023B8BB92|nr:caspase family protein [Kamptonema sp. UHCC 0994]MDF0555225.1 caspase family protein [Kamptonema sp. UHCC 0994]